jgi:hypothetical protein
MSSRIINHLPSIEDYTYLELGVFDNANFNTIACKNKHSVDMNGIALFTGTTDEYFASIGADTQFDIIFIDANHDYDYVLRDFNNSIDHATKWILMHDMIPPSKKYISPEKCSDSYKILYYMLSQEKFEIYPMNNNFGLTLIKLPAKKIYPSEGYKQISYSSFVEFMTTQKVYSDEEIIALLRNQNV